MIECRITDAINDARLRSPPAQGSAGFDLISDALPFGRLWSDTRDYAIGYSIHSSRSHHAVIRVYDAGGNLTETHEHKGDFKEW